MEMGYGATSNYGIVDVKIGVFGHQVTQVIKDKTRGGSSLGQEQSGALVYLLLRLRKQILPTIEKARP